MPEPTHQKRIPRLGWAIAFVVATAAMAYAYMQLRQAQKSTHSSHTQQFTPVPDFQFVTSDGERLSTADLAGQIWVANFIFTRCQGPCPMITGRMLELQQALQKGKVNGVRLVTVTVDPEYDTPEVLSQYAQQVGADPNLWKFATGPKEHVENTIKRGFLQPIIEADDGEIIHTARFVVVDRNGMMRTFPDGNDPEVVQKLLMDVGDIMREQPPTGTLRN